VVIGNDVWLGNDCTIFSGVTIGDGAVVGAEAVVGRDVAPYTIVAGNPAHSIGRRFGGLEVEDLIEKIKWWNWPDEKVKRFIPLLCSPDIGKFIKEAMLCQE
jgi:carbonic anhydrase/acetyltransferase-like protein (isoleucine patch superfamily)